MREPTRGESDESEEEQAGEELLEVVGRRGWQSLRADIKIAATVPSLRALIVGNALSTGAIAGIAYWAAPFYERHTSLGSGSAAGTVGGIILLGAIVGTIAGGRAADKAREHDVGAPMRLAGVTQFLGGAILGVSYLHMPLLIRLPLQLVGVAFLVAAFPALAAMVSEVVPAKIRGTAFAVTGFLGALASAASPFLIGVIADQFPIIVNGHRKGNLATAFLVVTPLILVGALVVLNGRRHVEGDIARVAGLLEPGA